ncbi:unnamed protein product [Trifolium pratense]|uniref:Uncharacterized protein n=1 Tax=Trifolium pratense TaxID=57577 RepID=A0ACB0J0V3_TRIPR|nr:unnamed protein product [Trifolium pratense]
MLTSLCSSGACSKSLFDSTSTSKNEGSGKEKSTEIEVEQQKKLAQDEPSKIVVILNAKEITSKEVESVAESLGIVDLSKNVDIGQQDTSKGQKSGRKWTRKKAGPSKKGKKTTKKEIELGKRQLVEVMVSEGNPEDLVGGGKKRRQDIVMEDVNATVTVTATEPEVVLENQHRLDQ